MHFKRLMTAVSVLAILCLSASCPAESGPSLGHSAVVPIKPLQELVRAKRPKGEIFVAIPQALIFGMDGNSRTRAYCSPQIRAINSSDKTVEELIIGIRYKGPDSKYVGSTNTRFFLLKVGNQDTFYFYSSINAKYCEGLEGDVNIVRCVYEDGSDCRDDVRPISYGAIPLRSIIEVQGEK